MPDIRVCPKCHDTLAPDEKHLCEITPNNAGMLDAESVQAMTEAVDDEGIGCGIDRSQPLSDDDTAKRFACSACGHLEPVPLLADKYKPDGLSPEDKAASDELGNDIISVIKKRERNKLVIEAGGVYEQPDGSVWHVDDIGGWRIAVFHDGTATSVVNSNGVFQPPSTRAPLVRPHTPAPEIEFDESWLYAWATCWALCPISSRWNQFEDIPEPSTVYGAPCWEHDGRSEFIPVKHAPTLPPGMRWQDSLRFVKEGK